MDVIHLFQYIIFLIGKLRYRKKLYSKYYKLFFNSFMNFNMIWNVKKLNNKIDQINYLN